MDAAGAVILTKRLEGADPAQLATYGKATIQVLELQKKLRESKS